MMVVPLFIGILINTFFPDLLKIGGFTQALTGVGYPTILGMYLFTVGTKITVTTAPRILVRGLGIMVAKVGQDHHGFGQPETVLEWQTRRFRRYWAQLSQHKNPGRASDQRRYPKAGEDDGRFRWKSRPPGL